MAAADLLKRGGAVLAFVSLENELDNVVSGIDDEVVEVLEDKARKMAESAKSKINNITGELADSIEIEVSELKGRVGFRVTADAKDAKGIPYAHMVEYGTQSMKSDEGYPFMIPTLEEYTQETLDAVNDKLKELADQ